MSHVKLGVWNTVVLSDLPRLTDSDSGICDTPQASAPRTSVASVTMILASPCLVASIWHANARINASTPCCAPECSQNQNEGQLRSSAYLQTAWTQQYLTGFECIAEQFRREDSQCLKRSQGPNESGVEKNDGHSSNFGRSVCLSFFLSFIQTMLTSESRVSGARRHGIRDGTRIG